MIDDRRVNDERILILEVEVKQLKEEQAKILACVQSIHGEMTRYKGFLGGIAFIISGILLAVSFIKDWISK